MSYYDYMRDAIINVVRDADADIVASLYAIAMELVSAERVNQ